MNETRDLRLFQWAGVLLGLGLGGFFDGIVFHQLFQWHHMLTGAGYPPDTVANLRLNTLADGLFHAATYVLTVIGVFLLWRARAADRLGSFGMLVGLLLIGWGAFNLVEGLVDHYLLGIHHVRDDLGPGMALRAWDLAFLLWGAATVIGGWLIYRRGKAPARMADSPSAAD